MADYRNTEYCEPFVNIKQKKQDFKKKIKKEHPKIEDYYRYISDKDGQYKLPFLKIYNKKCVYCGNSLDNLSIDLFEIDHYINKASFNKAEKSKANQIENLMPSCQMCNRGKSGIKIEGSYIDLVDPEGEKIKEVFYRDEKYNICISPSYKEDSFIANYYEALKLDRETRRIDYLLLKMRGMYSKLPEGHRCKGDLAELILKLQMKRNLIF